MKKLLGLIFGFVFLIAAVSLTTVNQPPGNFSNSVIQVADTFTDSNVNIAEANTYVDTGQNCLTLMSNGTILGVDNYNVASVYQNDTGQNLALAVTTGELSIANQFYGAENSAITMVSWQTITYNAGVTNVTITADNLTSFTLESLNKKSCQNLSAACAWDIRTVNYIA